MVRGWECGLWGPLRRGPHQGEVYGEGSTASSIAVDGGAVSLSGLRQLPSLAGLRVLIVDNEADARALMRVVLEGCGASVDEAESAAEALRCVQIDRPDVLLSDIAMPTEDGYSLIRKVRRRGPTVGPVPRRKRRPPRHCRSPQTSNSIRITGCRKRSTSRNAR